MNVKDIFKNIVPSVAVMVIGLGGAYFVYNAYFSDRIGADLASFEPAAGQEMMMEESDVENMHMDMEEHMGMEEHMDEMVDDAEEMMEDASEEAEEIMEDASEEAEEIMEDAAEEVEEMMEDAAEEVEETTEEDQL